MKDTNISTLMAESVKSLIDHLTIPTFLTSIPIAWASQAHGNWHLVEIWLLLSIADLILGILYAIGTHTFCFSRLIKWSCKVLVHFSTIALTAVITYSTSIALRFELAILDLYVAILICMEVGSICGHLVSLGWPVPPIFATIALGLKRKIKTEINKQVGVTDDESTTDKN